MFWRVACGLALASALWAQARIPPHSVVNAAGFAPPGLEGGALARGSIFTIFGQRIGPDSPAAATAFPLADNLNGVEIAITQGETSVQAIPLFVASGQINAILPSDAPLGAASLRVRNGVRRSNPVPVHIVASQPALFTSTGLGFGPGSAQNRASDGALTVNSPASPAVPGQLVDLYATGLGGVTFPDNEAASAGAIPGVEIELWIGGVPVAPEDILYAGRSPCCAGLDQLVARIPQSAPAGCYVPVHMRTNGGPLSNTATLAIAPPGAECPGFLLPDGAPPASAGLIAMIRTAIDDRLDRPFPLEYSLDLGAARFRSLPATPFAFDATLALPPEGACTLYQGTGAAVDVLARGLGGRLNAGESVEARPAGRSASLPEEPGPLSDYFRRVGGEAGNSGLTGRLGGVFWRAGDVGLSAAGGMGVPAFMARAIAPSELTWTNRGAIELVPRLEDLRLTWSGAGADAVLVAGGAYSPMHDASSVFACRAPPEAGELTVPAAILSSLPATETGTRSGAWLYVGSLAVSQFSADPVGAAVAAGLSGQAKAVILQ